MEMLIEGENGKYESGQYESFQCIYGIHFQELITFDFQWIIMKTYENSMKNSNRNWIFDSLKSCFSMFYCYCVLIECSWYQKIKLNFWVCYTRFYELHIIHVPFFWHRLEEIWKLLCFIMYNELSKNTTNAYEITGQENEISI